MPATKLAEGLYVGVMSGTSLDGVDTVIARFSPQFELMATRSSPFPSSLREQTLALCSSGDHEIDRLASLDRTLGEHYASEILALLQEHPSLRSDIVAIGCHGQTVRHRPGPHGFSLQLGSGDVMACRTGLPTVNNFRNRDMALGGQGAPLVPAFHAAAFGRAGERRAVVNIGGMANITLLDGTTVAGGYDTGPGNVLLDAWASRHLGMSHDAGGEWARGGQVIGELLQHLLTDEYFRMSAPKSTGRERFNAAWLAQHLSGNESPADVQATLVELTAESIAAELRTAEPSGVWVCGGGAHNTWLMERLRHQLSGIPCSTTLSIGLPPDWVEACAFAWLARARILEQPGNVPVVTGASALAVLGALYAP